MVVEAWNFPFLLCSTISWEMAFLVAIEASSFWLVKAFVEILFLSMRELLLKEGFISFIHSFREGKILFFDAHWIDLDSPLLLEAVMPQPFEVRLYLSAIYHSQECLPWGWETINSGLEKIIFIHHYSNTSKLISYLRDIGEEGGHCLIHLHL